MHSSETHTNLSWQRPQFTMNTYVISFDLQFHRFYDPHMYFQNKEKYSFLFSTSLPSLFFFPLLGLGAQIMWKDGDPSGQNMSLPPRFPQSRAQLLYKLTKPITKPICLKLYCATVNSVDSCQTVK